MYRYHICMVGISPPDDLTDSFNRGQHRQAMMKRVYRSDNRRYHTAGVVDDIKVSHTSIIHSLVQCACILLLLFTL